MLEREFLLLLLDKLARLAGDISVKTPVLELIVRRSLAACKMA